MCYNELTGGFFPFVIPSIRKQKCKHQTGKNNLTLDENDAIKDHTMARFIPHRLTVGCARKGGGKERRLLSPLKRFSEL